MNLWDLDYPFWEHVVPHQFPGKDEEAFVKEYKVGPLQSEMESLVRKKCEDLKRYQDEIKGIPNERIRRGIMSECGALGSASGSLVGDCKFVDTL
jgi:hypothetical protein